MSENMPQSKDLRTPGIVLRRTNYAEADRILNIITPVGKITAIVKGVRRLKSKLAGGVEIFSLVDFNIHQGRSEMGVVTGAKMVQHYGEILKDFRRLELAGVILKKINQVAENSDSPEYFRLAEQCLAELNRGANLELVEGWFWLNLLRAMGEEVNLYRDVSGEKLAAEKTYNWDAMQMAFSEGEQGEYGANEIKMLRLMAATDLKVVRRVKIEVGMVDKLLSLIRMVARA